MHMKNNKLIILLVLLLLLVFGNLMAQRLLVHNTGDTGKDTTYKVELGDVVLVAHQLPGKQVHYFQGKVTGIFKDRGVVRIFDYARSSRMMPIVGKKIRIDEIVGIRQLDKDAYKKRERAAVAAKMASSIGAGMGGKPGKAVQWGAAAGNIGNDILTREQMSKQKITVEFID